MRGQPCAARLEHVAAKGDDHLGNFIAWERPPARQMGPCRSLLGVERRAAMRDVVFYGTLEGSLKRSSRDGQEIYKFKISRDHRQRQNLRVDGKQYSAVLIGSAGGRTYASRMAGPPPATRIGPRRGGAYKALSNYTAIGGQ